MSNKSHFHIDAVYPQARYDACRRAVFTPLLTGGWYRKGPKKAYASLRRLWSSRIQALAAAGWLPAEGGLRQQYLRNCPPFGVKISPADFRSCKRPVVCPFCYAREHIFKVFTHLESFLFPSDRHKRPVGVHLVAFEWFGQVTGAGSWSPDNLRASLAWHGSPDGAYRAKALLELEENRRRELDAFGADYGAVLYRFEPHPDKLLIRRSGLLLTDDSERADTTCWRSTKIQVWSKPTKRALRDACQRFFGYAKPMLTADPVMTVALLNALHHKRLLSLYGGVARADVEV